MKPSMRIMILSVFMLLLSVAAFAQTPETSTLPVTEPLDVGGTILQPGNYVIRIVPSFTDRNKVQVLSPDLKKVYATVLTIPHQLEPNEEIANTTFVYYPAGENAPRALRTWFAPHPDASQGGHDIVYDESRAKQLARLNKSDVVYYTKMDDTTLHVVTPEAKIETYTYTPPTPPPAPVVVETRTETVTTPMVSSTTERTEMEMPATASNVPLFALLGMVAIGGAVAVRFVRPE